MCGSGLRRAAVVAALAGALVVGGCAAPAGPAGPASPTPTTTIHGDPFGPGAIVLRVQYSGGLGGGLLAESLPALSLYGDGRVITEESYSAGGYPPSAVIRQVSPRGLAQLLRLAFEAGVGASRDLGDLATTVADATTTRISVISSQGPQTTSVYALGIGTNSPQLTVEQREAREALVAFLRKLEDLPATLGPDEVGEPRPYDPAAFVVFVRPWSGELDGRPPIAWPGPALSGPCVELAGDDLAAVADAAGPVTEEPRTWVWDGAQYSLRFRPLLPDESSCADLVR